MIDLNVVPQIRAGNFNEKHYTKNLRSTVLAVVDPLEYQQNLQSQYATGHNKSDCQDYWTTNNIIIGQDSDVKGTWFKNNCWVYSSTGWLNAMKVEWDQASRSYYANDYWVCKDQKIYIFYYPEDCSLITQYIPDLN